MSMYRKHDYAKFLEDKESREMVIETALSDPRVVNEIVEDVAGEISDILEDDHSFREKLISTAARSENFRKSVGNVFVKEFID